MSANLSTTRITISDFNILSSVICFLSSDIRLRVCVLRVTINNLRIGVIFVGAAFQPRLNDYGFMATSFHGWNSHSHEQLMLI